MVPCPPPSINAPGCEQCAPSQVFDLTMRLRLVFPSLKRGAPTQRAPRCLATTTAGDLLAYR